MHCPRCGNSATVGQQFCRSCGFNLEKIAELLGEQLASDQSSGNKIARLRERQRKLERWGGIAGLSTFGVILIMLIVVVFHQRILKGETIVVPGVLLILLAIGAATTELLTTASGADTGEIDD